MESAGLEVNVGASKLPGRSLQGVGREDTRNVVTDWLIPSVSTDYAMQSIF